ncbi:MAG: Rrf2 family transcriptional regulator [Calditrichaeota bacterium]|nr:Rrf2 family transcriptional regulator [Calditrichota bacterium]RQV99943.1 MAG: Rrf2 family transcriptional regulator [Calditrichota bacterium]
MLKLSKKVEYALIGMIHMSRKGDGELTTTRELINCYNIPPELMGKVLQRLAKADLIKSEQGVKGGYLLSRSTGSISVRDVLHTIDGTVKIVDCLKLDRDNANCDQSSACIIRSPMIIIQNKLEHLFNSLSLEDIAGEIMPNHQEKKRPSKKSYSKKLPEESLNATMDKSDCRRRI